MSLDRLQSKPGVFSIQAEPSYTVAASLSSIASNQYPGGYQFGQQFGILGASGTSAGGGAMVIASPSTAGQTYAASSGTGAMLTHGNAPILFASLSAGGLHNLQPPTYPGQVLSVVNVAAVSGSFVTGAVISGNGSGSTTTAVVPTLAAAGTFGSSAGASALRVFVGIANPTGTASNSTLAVWQQITP